MTFLLRRILHAAVVVFGVATIVFVLARATGDPAALLVPPEASPADAARIRQLLGLDRPLYEQYGSYLLELLHGDFGTSFRQNAPALPLVLERLPATLALAAAALLVSIGVGVPLGLLSAVKRGTGWDRVTTLIAALGQATPPFWLGVAAILVFGVHLRWLPVMGSGGVDHLVLPAITLAAYPVGMIAQLFRVSLLEVLNHDYIRTAHAKGLGPRKVLFGHVVRNASIPLASILGLQVATLLGGAIVVETVFNYPGVGLLAVKSILGGDYPVVQTYVLVTATLVVATSLVTDVIYLYLDPRIRYER